MRQDGVLPPPIVVFAWIKKLFQRDQPLERSANWQVRGVPLPPGQAGGSRRIEPPEARPVVSQEVQVQASPEQPTAEHLDDVRRLRGYVSNEEREIMQRVELRIEKRRFKLPQMRATQMAAMDLAANPDVEVRNLVRLISTDPVLSSEVLRTANSVLYATAEPAETLHEAVMRIGLRTLRSLIFTITIRGSIMKMDGLQTYADEVWRQAYGVGSIARRIAPYVGEEAEKSFLLGLLHDIGKIVLLSILSTEKVPPQALTPSLIGRVFSRYHERAGAVMAEHWRLSEEFASVASRHHDYKSNTDYARSAALVCLAHQIDLVLTLGAESRFNALARHSIMDFLKIPENRRHRLLREAREAFEEDASEGMEQTAA